MGPSTRDVPSGWEAAAPLARATDLDPDPGVVEINLVAAPMRWTIEPGHEVDGYAYNGSVPGPLIEAKAGDTLVVHFRNELPEPTTIHWHGVRVPAEMDGGPHSQMPVEPGGTFEYHFTLPDAGTFWYHPHVDEPMQMERGLYGAIVVRGDGEPAADTEAVVMLDDLTLDATGEIAPFGDLLEQHGGREGSVQLVNGRVTPAIAARAGERQRWRVVNAGSARIYRLVLAGQQFTLVGTDGGALGSPSAQDEMLLVPGDRADVLVDLQGSPGQAVALTAEPYARGHGNGVFVSTTVASLSLSDQAPLQRLQPYQGSRAIDPLSDDGATPRELLFNESIDATAQTVTFTINGESYPNVTPVPARVGAMEVWDLVNESEMDHPFHLHGFFFQVLSRDGVPEQERTWEDTIDLHGTERVRIAFQPDDRPGMWMFHCHILEHAHNGMMGVLELSP